MKNVGISIVHCAAISRIAGVTRISRIAWIPDVPEIAQMGIPLKVGSDPDLKPVTGSGVKPGVFGAQQR